MKRLLIALSVPLIIIIILFYPHSMIKTTTIFTPNHYTKIFGLTERGCVDFRSNYTLASELTGHLAEVDVCVLGYNWKHEYERETRLLIYDMFGYEWDQTE